MTKNLQINQKAFSAYYRGNIVLEALGTTQRQIVDSRVGLKGVLKNFSIKKLKTKKLL